ncbi:hypothetical protein BGW38_010951, partial [Lunasporangiospora selenospora]
NLYGCHPFYLEVLPSGSAHGVLLLNSNGMDVQLSKEGDRLSFKVVGGLLDLYVFTGPTPQQVVQQYLELIGRPCMIPYWALGYHQCRWGYDSLQKVKDVVSMFKKHSIPLEAIWIDIDYMKDYKAFEIDEDRYPIKKTAQWIRDLHNQDQKIVMILDPGIKTQYKTGLYEPYDTGIAKKLFIQRKVIKEEKTKDGTIRRPGDLTPFVAKQWPGKITFPDWLHPETSEYWHEHIAAWLQQTPIDGIWIDMNEPASFHNGDFSSELSEDLPIQLGHFAPQPKKTKKSQAAPQQPQRQHQEQRPESSTLQKEDEEKSLDPQDTISTDAIPKHTIARDEQDHEVEYNPHSHEHHPAQHNQPLASMLAADDALELSPGTETPRPPLVYASPNDPPYRINNNSEKADLEYRTVSVDALHHNGVLEYDAHNLFGHMEGIATYHSLRRLYPNRKPFILSRSTFVGSGQYVCKWLGDNFSEFPQLKASISGMLNFQLFGIGMVGADVGGFVDIASEELLIRWHQLGAFYPFLRNHNHLVNPPQEPYTSKALTEVTRHMMGLRYSLLPWWYTLFYRFHQDGQMVLSPLWILDPADPNLISIDEQFLVGEAILVSPVLQRKHTSVAATFPRGRWYNIYSGCLEVQAAPATAEPGSRVYELDAPLTSIPVHLRGGCILPRASLVSSTAFMTTTQVQQAPLEILVALDERGQAQGEYYHDDDSFAPVDGTLVQMRISTPGVLTVSSRPMDPTLGLKEKRRQKQSQVELNPRSLRVHKIQICGIGLDGVSPGWVPPESHMSAVHLETRQVRVSIVRPPAQGTKTLQHQHELEAIPVSKLKMSWDARLAQLVVLLNHKSSKGYDIPADCSLEVDWTEALVA